MHCARSPPRLPDAPRRLWRSRVFRRDRRSTRARGPSTHPMNDRKAEHHDRYAAVGHAGIESLLRVENAAVRGIKTRLRDGAHRARGREERLKANRCPGAEFRTRLQSHPGARNHAERSFRADQRAVRTWTGARARQAPRFQDTARRNHAQAFDEIINVGVEARKMPTRPCRDPAAKRRIFKALGKMPQRNAMWLELPFQ